MPLALRLDSELLHLLDRVAQSMGMSRSEVVRAAIRKYCARALEEDATPYEKAKDLIGCAEGGPPDLATNVRKYVLESLAHETRGPR